VVRLVVVMTSPGIVTVTVDGTGSDVTGPPWADLPASAGAVRTQRVSTPTAVAVAALILCRVFSLTSENRESLLMRY
jgi:hypothetical protein